MENFFSQQRGSGHAIVLLHGFPFHQAIWNGFAEKLSKNFQVFTPDLPGFGKSPSLNSPFSLDDVAEQVVAWTREKKLSGFTLVGHSLGGYVALAIAQKAPELLSDLILFHSTAYADAEEKKQSRNKVLEFIEKNGVAAFTSNFIGPLFIDQNHPAIPIVRTIALEAEKKTVVDYTKAMRDREERTDVLSSFTKRILFLAGAKDPGISVESISKQAALCVKPHTEILVDAAHMGMFETENKCLEIIRDFIKNNTVTK